MAGAATAGAFFGPGDVVTVPIGAATGLVGGAALGQIAGLISCMSSTGTGGGGATGGSKIQFGKTDNQVYHTFRHVEEAGLDKDAVKSAIEDDLSSGADSLPQGQLKTGNVTVGGRSVIYNAFKLPNGTINVGRITVR